MSLQANCQSNLPWWKHGYVWLVISGPVVVVIAGLITAWLTLLAPDPVLSRAERSPTPAVQARNHAADPTAAVQPKFDRPVDQVQPR